MTTSRTSAAPASPSRTPTPPAAAAAGSPSRRNQRHFGQEPTKPRSRGAFLGRRRGGPCARPHLCPNRHRVRTASISSPAPPTSTCPVAVGAGLAPARPARTATASGPPNDSPPRLTSTCPVAVAGLAPPASRSRPSPRDNPNMCPVPRANRSASRPRSTKSPAASSRSPSARCRALRFSPTSLSAAPASQLLRDIRDKHGLLVYAYCLMPDHVHLLAAMVSRESITVAIKSWKSLCYQERRRLGNSARFWQRSFFDRMIRDDEEIFGVATYILMNPVRAGLVRDFHDYPLCGSFEFTL